MNEPTQEQIKEFWEWCGLHYHGEAGELLVYAPDGTVFNCGQPRIDLNNLFKYAVPKLDKMGNHLILRSHVYSESLVDSPDYEAEIAGGIKSHSIDPALALFWAIWKVISNG